MPGTLDHAGLEAKILMRGSGTMKSRAGQVSVGDRFIKASTYSRTVYVVQSIHESHGIPPHVRLVAEGQTDSMLMSVSALLDPHFWWRIPPERDRDRQQG